MRRIFGGDFNATIVTNSKESPALPGFGEFYPPSCYERAKSTSFNGHALLAAARQYKMFLEQSYFKNRRACHSWTFRSNNATKYRRRLDLFLVDKSIHAHTVSCRSHPNPANSDHRCATKKPNKPRLPKPNYSLLTSDPGIRIKYQQALQQQAEQISCFSDNSLNRMHEII